MPANRTAAHLIDLHLHVGIVDGIDRDSSACWRGVPARYSSWLASNIAGLSREPTLKLSGLVLAQGLAELIVEFAALKAHLVGGAPLRSARLMLERVVIEVEKLAPGSSGSMRTWVGSNAASSSGLLNSTYQGVIGGPIAPRGIAPGDAQGPVGAEREALRRWRSQRPFSEGVPGLIVTVMDASAGSGS